MFDLVEVEETGTGRCRVYHSVEFGNESSNESALVSREKDSGAGALVNEHGAVLGRLGRKALAMEEDVAVEAVMTAGPSTVRPSITLADIVERMQSQKLTSALVTRSDGRLVGLLRRTDAEAALDAASSDPSLSSQGREGR